MYRFEWNDLILPDFIAQLRELAGDRRTSEETLRDLLSDILRTTGGLPLSLSEWDADHRSAVVGKLLEEALGRLLKYRYGFQHASLGVLLNREDLPEAHAQIDINYASEETLEALPVIGPALAKRIVATRRRVGAFRSLEDLSDKVKGIGLENIKPLAGILGFSTDGRPITPAIVGTWEEDFKAALALKRVVNSPSPLAALLEELAVFAATQPHPATALGIKRSDLEPELRTPTSSSWLPATGVRVLMDEDYYPNLLTLLDSASQSIDVCMFFIALGDEAHPTRKLLEKLREKSDQGVKVRVLMDRDNPDDPYGSRIINVRAARFLAGHGVAVRTDRRDQLLHSKFVLIDDDQVVIGSHNWTSGSYFDYQDLSLVLRGAAPNRAWKQRFSRLWQVGTDFRSNVE
jgi:hypothetical protein